MIITLRGMDNAQQQIDRIARGTAAMSRYNFLVGTRLPYGYGQEFAYHRVSGKLARRAGPALYLTHAKEAMLADADRDIAEGLKRVTAPGPWVLRRLARWVRRLARVDAPVGSGRDPHPGRLRRAIHVETRR